MDSGGKAKKHGGSATLAYVIGFSMIHTCNWQMKRIKNLSPIFFQARLKTGKREQALEDSCEVVLEWKFNIMRCLVQNDRIRLQWQRDKASFEILIYFYTICIIQPKNLIHCGIAAKLTQSSSQFPSIDEQSSWRSECRVRLSPKQGHPKSRLIYYINSLID